MTEPNPTPHNRAAAFQDRATAGAKGLAKVGAGFKEFISRGNAVELAVGVVIGAAFGAVVKSLQDNFISPLIGWIFGKPNLDNLWDLGPYSWYHPDDPADAPQPIHIGAIFSALLQFLITAAAIYFLIVLPLNALAKRRKRGIEEEPAAPAEDILLLQEIRDLLADRLTPAVANDTTPGATPPGPPATPPGGFGAPGTPPSFPPAGS